MDPCTSAVDGEHTPGICSDESEALHLWTDITHANQSDGRFALMKHEGVNFTEVFYFIKRPSLQGILLELARVVLCSQLKLDTEDKTKARRQRRY